MSAETRSLAWRINDALGFAIGVMALALIPVLAVISCRHERVDEARRQALHFFEHIQEGNFDLAAEQLCADAQQWATENALRLASERLTFRSVDGLSSHEPVLRIVVTSPRSTTARVALWDEGVSTVREIRVIDDSDREHGDDWRVCPRGPDTLFGTTP